VLHGPHRLPRVDRAAAPQRERLTWPDSNPVRLGFSDAMHDESRSFFPVRYGVVQHEMEDDLVVARVDMRLDVRSRNVVQVDSPVRRLDGEADRVGDCRAQLAADSEVREEASRLACAVLPPRGAPRLLSKELDQTVADERQAAKRCDAAAEEAVGQDDELAPELSSACPRRWTVPVCELADDQAHDVGERFPALPVRAGEGLEPVRELDFVSGRLEPGEELVDQRLSTGYHSLAGCERCAALRERAGENCRCGFLTSHPFVTTLAQRFRYSERSDTMSDAEKMDQGEDETERQALEDLDAGDDAEKVVGGRISCPCEGGEFHRQA
jgi:hypothetical protein